MARIVVISKRSARIFGSLLVFFIMVYGFAFGTKLAFSKKLVARAVPFELSGPTDGTTLLVLGDSTAVGVGAGKPENSVAGLLARHVGATYVENRAKSGAQTADLLSQIGEAELARYTYILIEIGGNDIIRLHAAMHAADMLEEALGRLPNADHVIVHSAGNVGAATLFPRIIRPLHTKLNLAYHEAFTNAVASKYSAVYVNLYVEPAEDPFVRESDAYFAGDGLHPSAAGYRLWFEKIATALEARESL